MQWSLNGPHRATVNQFPRTIELMPHKRPVVCSLKRIYLSKGYSLSCAPVPCQPLPHTCTICAWWSYHPRPGFIQCSSGLQLSASVEGWGEKGGWWGTVQSPSSHTCVPGGSILKVASEASEEAQALLVLRRWQEMPGLGIQLVPEHVETRPLYHPRSPGLLQVRGCPTLSRL